MQTWDNNSMLGDRWKELRPKYQTSYCFLLLISFRGFLWFWMMVLCVLYTFWLKFLWFLRLSLREKDEYEDKGGNSGKPSIACQSVQAIGRNEGIALIPQGGVRVITAGLLRAYLTSQRRWGALPSLIYLPQSGICPPCSHGTASSWCSGQWCRVWLLRCLSSSGLLSRRLTALTFPGRWKGCCSTFVISKLRWECWTLLGSWQFELAIGNTVGVLAQNLFLDQNLWLLSKQEKSIIDHHPCDLGQRSLLTSRRLQDTCVIYVHKEMLFEWATIYTLHWDHLYVCVCVCVCEVTTMCFIE